MWHSKIREAYSVFLFWWPSCVWCLGLLCKFFILDRQLLWSFPKYSKDVGLNRYGGWGGMTNWGSTLLAMCLDCRLLSNGRRGLKWLMASELYLHRITVNLQNVEVWFSEFRVIRVMMRFIHIVPNKLKFEMTNIDIEFQRPVNECHNGSIFFQFSSIEKYNSGNYVPEKMCI
jgi:hypothetical protein